ncbi:lipid-transfer protein [Shimia abyssi]|uniref:propanoyl-CoA C-acyltransferase n=1 Tax=Shimia abyssi TaxID=1662395 RepID=A0A2P8F7K7_9RHOB|nr:lipid-transfer protein [Shimia abyssi]PSL17703.1 acetyl-CoA acetyltransferase [Shimia abyssi]
MTKHAIVAGVGMIKFTKPGASDTYDKMGAAAIRNALTDAGITYSDVQQAYAGYVYGDSTSGQKALYNVGMTGIPIVNVNNNCSTGSTALYLARQAIEHGVAECVLAVGFEQMRAGALGSHWLDRPTPFDDFDTETDALVGNAQIPVALRYFGGAGKSHMEKFGTTLSDFARIRAKASRHAVRNPLALFNKEISEEEVLAAPMLWDGVMTRLMACPPTCGGAAAILCSEKFALKHGLSAKVKITAQSMTTDTPSTFEAHDMMQLVGYDMAKSARDAVSETSGIGPDDIDVIELHDCFTHNELITYEALGLCPEGNAQQFIADGNNTYGGNIVTNPSGGLLSKGHPLGATGLAQCYELTHQLRGTAEARQVDDARIALQHNLGIGGACVVTLYQAT